MQTGLNFYTAVFLLLLYCKGRGLPFFGAVPSWAAVVAPLALWGVAVIVQQIGKTFNWEARIRFALWKFVLGRRLKQIADNAKKTTFSHLNKTANPGQFQDPANYGK